MGVGSTSFEVVLSESVDLQASLDVFRRPGDDLIDRFDGRTMARTVPTEFGYVPYAFDVSVGLWDRMKVRANDGAHELAITMAVTNTFVHPKDDWRRLLADDPKLRTLDARHPGIRAVFQHDLFNALVRSISAQQINLRWAATIRSRLAQRFGDRHRIGDWEVYSLNWNRIAVADPAEIRAMQFTARKAESVVLLAREFADGTLSLDLLRSLPDEEVIARLTALRGLGIWSAEWILSRTLGRPRVVAGDLGVRKAIGRLYMDGAMPSEEEVRKVTAHWGESASVAQGLALHWLAVGAT